MLQTQSPEVAKGVFTLNSIKEYKHPGVVTKLQQEHDLTEGEAEQLFEDTKLFLYLTQVAPEAARPTAWIDEGWHSFILFTKDYAEFCEQFFGRFVHHNPIIGGSSNNRALGVQSTVETAVRVFGDNLSMYWTDTFTNSNDCAPESNCESAPPDCAVNH